MPDPARVREDLGSSLRNLEKERARTEAERAFAELDEQLWRRLRDRHYATARNEWRSRLERSTFAPIHERMSRRLRYCEDLVELRERVRGEFVKQIGKRTSLTLRSGAAVSGKLVHAEAREDDFLLTFAEGTAPQAPVSALSASDVEKWAALSDQPGERYARGVFWLAEGDSDRARADFAAARASSLDADVAARAAAALADADALKLLSSSGAGARDGRFEEARRKARAFAAIGETELAREWYATARREADGFSEGDPRLTELDAEVRQFEATARDAARERGLAQAFPGARARDLGDGRVELLYDFNDRAKVPALELGDGWSLTPAGAMFAPAKPATGELVKLGGAKLTIGAVVKGPARAVARVTVPMDGKEPPEPLRGFAAFGRTVLFAGGLTRHGILTAVRGGGFEGAEAELRAAAASAAPPKSSFGLLRGGTHEIEVSVEADGKAFSVALDGYIVARGEGAALSDAFELRANAPLVWHGLRFDGKLTPKR
jgi:hypothetical protein